jgi:hypothetical protein
MAEPPAAEPPAAEPPPAADPPPAAEEKAAVGLVPTASFWTRYEFREGYADIGRAHPRFREMDMFWYRARFGLSTTPVDVGNGKNVVVFFEPQASGFWGDKNEGKPNNIADGALGIHQAKVRINGEGGGWLDAGRFEMAYGEHVVIGTVGWHQTARTFDGIRGHLKMDKGWLDLFFTQNYETPADQAPFGAGDAYFMGAYAGLGEMVGEGVDLDAYVLADVAPRSAPDPDELAANVTVGSRFKKKMGNLDIRAEAGVQFWAAGGPGGFAWHGLAEVGHKLGDATRVAAQGFAASGDDPTTTENEGWRQLYPTAHKFMGWMDIIGPRTNIMGGILRGRHKVGKTALGADAHVFLRMQPSTAGGSDDALAGIEIDTFAKHPLGKNLFVKGGYSIFLPGEDVYGPDKDPVHYVEATLGYTLK